MSRSVNDYLIQLAALMPPGPAWTADDDTLLSAFAHEFARIDGRAMTLIDETLPNTTFEMLTDWERVSGIPGNFLSIDDLTVSQRVEQLVFMLALIGGQSVSYYIDIARRFGSEITIDEFEGHTVDHDVEHPLFDKEWDYAWIVNTQLMNFWEFSVDDTVDDPLALWGNKTLENILNYIKPAHTRLLFNYMGSG